jgi:hypothetical protein
MEIMDAQRRAVRCRFKGEGWAFSRAKVALRWDSAREGIQSVEPRRLILFRGPLLLDRAQTTVPRDNREL